MRKSIYIILLVLNYISNAQAMDICTQYENTIPLPNWYTTYCVINKSSVGGGFATYADAFSMNPSAIPTINLPFGLEASYSAAASGETLPSKFNLSILKGFDGFGIGLASNSDDSIFSNRSIRSATKFKQTLDTSYLPQGSTLPSLNGAIALSLGSSFPQIGLLGRYDKNYKTINPGIGASYHISYFSFGVSLIKEAKNIDYPSATIYTFNLGGKILAVNFEYAKIVTDMDRVPISGTRITSTGPSSANLFTASTNIAAFTFSGALRNTQTADLQNESIYHASVRYQLTSGINLAYFYNYVPGYHTLSLQLFI